MTNLKTNFKFFRCIANQPLDTTTPLGLLASKYAIINCDHTDDDSLTLYAYNTLNGRCILAINMSSYRKLLAELNAVLSELGLTSLESVFNELVGISTPITPTTTEVYSQFGNIYQKYLGNGPCSESTALTNFNALLSYVSVIPTIQSYESVNQQLGSLASVQNIHLLLQDIAQTSDILDAYGQSDSSIEILDNLYPILTKSGYLLSNLMGQRDLITPVEDGVQCLLDNLQASDLINLLGAALYERALDENFGNNELSVLYTNTNCGSST